MNSAIKSQIVDAIAKSDDPSMKTVLLLLLHLQEEIGAKIDAVLADEQSLREIVLNGSAAEHDIDHSWVRDRRALEADNKQSSRKIRDGIIQNIVWAALASGATLFFSRML